MELYKLLKVIEGKGTIVDNRDESLCGGVYNFENKYRVVNGLKHSGDEKRFRRILWNKVEYIEVRNGEFYIEV